MRRPPAWMLGTLFLLAWLPVAPARAQTIALSLDTAALDAILDAEYGRNHQLNSGFSVKGLTISAISVFAVTATFDLVFSGSLEIPVPFTRPRRIHVGHTMALQATFAPVFDGRKIEVPVRGITISSQNVKLGLNNYALHILVAFKRWLLSEQGKSVLERRLSLDLQPTLTSWFGRKSFTGKVALAADRLTLHLSPKP